METKQNRILVVDDEANHLKTVQRLFSDSDYILAFAESGNAALALLPEFKPDLVILDVAMPEMDGYQLCRIIKSDMNQRDTMVLMLSGYHRTSDRLAGYHVDADDYLTKPFDPKELKAKVRILLRLKNTLDQLHDLNDSLGQLVRKRTRELMEKEYEAMVGRMVQGIVHNLRGPLTAIQGSNEIAELLIQQMLNDNESSSGAAETLQKLSQQHARINQVVGRSEEMLSGLLAKSRKEAAADCQELNLNQVIREELHFLNTDRSMGRMVSKKVELCDTLPSILGRYSDFSQLIYNMVKNAADAMRDRPVRELTITTRVETNDIELAFQDTGGGIPPEHIDHIFDLYYTTKTPPADKTSGKSEGSGIGLYTCDQIVRSYGGQISVASKQGEGTQFIIRIPLSPGESASAC